MTLFVFAVGMESYSVTQHKQTRNTHWNIIPIESSFNDQKAVGHLKLSRASPSCPLALSVLHLHLLFNPQSLSLSLSISFTACASYLLHPLYQFFSLSTPLQTRMPCPLRGRLDSVTHHGAGVGASLLLSSPPVCPSGLVVTQLAQWRDDGRRNDNNKKEEKREGWREIKITGEQL